MSRTGRRNGHRRRAERDGHHVSHGPVDPLPPGLLNGQSLQHALREAVANLPVKAVPDALARLIKSLASRDPRRELRRFLLGLVVGNHLGSNHDFHRAAKQEANADPSDACPIDREALFTELRG